MFKTLVSSSPIKQSLLTTIQKVGCILVFFLYYYCPTHMNEQFDNQLLSKALEISKVELKDIINNDGF